MDEFQFGYLKAQWSILDNILMYLNSVDTANKNGNDVKKEIYHYIFEMRPK